MKLKLLKLTEIAGIKFYAQDNFLATCFKSGQNPFNSWHSVRSLQNLKSCKSSQIKGILQRSADEKRPQFSKISNFDMIVIHIGEQIHPVKDSAERGLIFSKYRFFLIFGIQK